MTSTSRGIGLIAGALLVLMAGWANPLPAQVGCGGHGHHRHVCCPQCACECCELEIKQDKEKKTCFKVATKTICIPPVWLPWQKCPPAQGATRKVCVLEEDSYECPTCKYTWKVKEPAPATKAAKSGDAADLQGPPWPNQATPLSPLPPIRVVPSQTNSPQAPVSPPVAAAPYYSGW